MKRLSQLYYITSLRQVLFQENCFLLAGLGVEIHKCWSWRPLGSKWIQGGNYSLSGISYIWPGLTLGHCTYWISCSLLAMKIITLHCRAIVIFCVYVFFVFKKCFSLIWKQRVCRLQVVCPLVSGVLGQVTQILTGFITHLHCGLQCTPYANWR